MRLLRQYVNAPKDCRRAVVAIGNFDGVHLGHRAVLAEARRIAGDLGAPLAVMAFEPHPRRLFQPEAPPFRLTLLRAKQHELAAQGVDVLMALEFDRAMADMAAGDFIADVLVQALEARHVIVGEDFRFGKDRTGDAAFLAAEAGKQGFGFTAIAPVGDSGLPDGSDGEVYSSSRVRQALRDGKPAAAAAMLGHWWIVEGIVERGDERGRQIGFPTANLAMGDYIRPRFGVYVVRVGLEDDQGEIERTLEGVANMGRRPTIGDDKVLLEVHLFDFDEEIYGRGLRVSMVDFIRDEQKFDGLEALKLQIADDAENARRILGDPAKRADLFENP